MRGETGPGHHPLEPHQNQSYILFPIPAPDEGLFLQESDRLLNLFILPLLHTTVKIATFKPCTNRPQILCQWGRLVRYALPHSHHYAAMHLGYFGHRSSALSPHPIFMIKVLPAVLLDRKTVVNLHLRRPIYRQHQFDNGRLIGPRHFRQPRCT